MKHYILDGKKVVPAIDVMAWARWFETANRRVAITEIGDVKVSTMFLGLDHRFGEQGDPLLFETMVFGGPRDGHEDRYTTWEQAETGHAKVVEMVKRQ